MRLTHLKLAGFKSFVDPTTLHLHGQRVGIVGPNGCGKSNVMEAIRWVLGESSAREMRGDTMQDVIFNGAAGRKPVSRASVELVFDNSLGLAAGSWSSYAEISVKRVLERERGSDYLINNTPVRRRDVADLFLGTGLGGRAYAIVGQNTISRIVEAKPEELRVFLEEAAGVSKYKERRRETESRLRETRSNLTRVEDICTELGKQISRLESQSMVARQYQSLQQDLDLAQDRIWLFKSREASRLWEKSRQQGGRLANDLEARMAALRKVESTLETLRQQHQECASSLQSAQAAYYGINAQVATLEQELQHRKDTSARLANRLAQIDAERELVGARRATLLEQQTQCDGERQSALGRVEIAQSGLEQRRVALPAIEAQAEVARSALLAAQNSITHDGQRVDFEQHTLERDRKTQADIEQRLAQLQHEESTLADPEGAALVPLEQAARQAQDAVAAAETGLRTLLDAERRQAEQVRLEYQATRERGELLARAQAQHAALQEMQQALGVAGDAGQWLGQHGMGSAQRLWSFVQAEPGHEVALEGFLGARLNAVVGPDHCPGDRPLAALTLINGDVVESREIPAHARGWKPLMSCLRAGHPLPGAILDWLGHAWVLPDAIDPWAARVHLLPGESLVTRSGDVYTRHSVTYHAPLSGLHGVFERQRELGEGAARLPQMSRDLEQQQKVLAAAEAALHVLRAEVEHGQHAVREKTAAAHASNLQVQQMQQRLQHDAGQRARIHAECDALAQRKTALEAGVQRGEESVLALHGHLARQEAEFPQVQAQQQSAETALQQARERLLEAERNAQGRAFDMEIISNRIKEISIQLNSIDNEENKMAEQRVQVCADLEQIDPDSLKPQLMEALEARRQAEQTLARARESLDEAEQQMQDLARTRLQEEQQLHPMRDRLEQARLAEQQARLRFEEYSAHISATGLDREVLEKGLDSVSRLDDLEQRAEHIREEMNALGAVNLAAIHELEAEKERKGYLDNQMADLQQAIATLEAAIHRIDAETRSRLQAAFDEVNRHFGELFSTLFRGGQAELQMAGEGILDAGMQVFAQPPGKRNSTIHLLSGGEKALTALALVFSLFRLNPAPFCLLDEVDAPLDDSNTEGFCALVRKMAERTQFLFVTHNKITMEMAQQLVGVTMQESGVSCIVDVDIEAVVRMQAEMALA